MKTQSALAALDPIVAATLQGPIVVAAALLIAGVLATLAARWL